MADVFVRFFADYGLFALWALVLADQAGLPLPAVPCLLYAGVLVRAHSLSFWPAFAGCWVASCAGHTLWYAAGRQRGPAIVRLLCGMSLSPDTCVRRTQEAFARVGPWHLLWMRFVPGLDVMAQPLVAINGMAWGEYLTVTALGTVLWTGTYMGLGYVVGNAQVIAVLHAAGTHALPLLAVLFVLYLMSKISWQLFHNTNEVPRLQPQGLQDLLQAQALAPVIIVDLRRRYELKKSGRQIPGARRLSRRELRRLAHNPAASTTAVMVCECPREAGSAFMASVFKRNGWQQTYALVGGFERWLAEGRPTEQLSKAAQNVDL